MSPHTPVHTTFTIEHSWPVSAAEVFAAWADPEAKAMWFADTAGSHSLDFRVGGTETLSDSLQVPGWTFSATYHKIIHDELILFSSTMSHQGDLTTVSTTMVELHPTSVGTLLRLTEQGIFLSDLERPEWRERGTADWLHKLGNQLTGATV